MSTLLRPSQRTALQQDLAAAEASLNNPMSAPYIQDKQAARKQAMNLKKALERDAPKPYESAQEKDAAMLRERELREEILTGMLSVEEMRRNRPGSVDKHRRWEMANKPKIKEWKDIKLRLEPDSEDRDLTNLERYRPERPFIYDANAQIAGHHAMSAQAKENWPEEMAEPKAKTAVSHLKK